MSAGLPMYHRSANKVTQETIQTSDLGRGMVTSKWNDINKFKVPVLRGLAGHAPYFHNGSAATLGDVIDAYQAAGFQFNFTPEERAESDCVLGSALKPPAGMNGRHERLTCRGARVLEFSRF